MSSCRDAGTQAFYLFDIPTLRHACTCAIHVAGLRPCTLACKCIHQRADLPHTPHANLPACVDVCSFAIQHVGMKIISVVSRKGGSGKTTLTLNLAMAAIEAGQKVVVIDLDPQQSSSRCARLRSSEEPVIVSAHAPILPALIEKAREGRADLVVIDTPPESGTAALLAAKSADLILIPCQPSGLDLDAVGDTVNIAKLAGKPAMFVLNGCKAASSLADMAADVLSDYQVPLAPVRIGSRVAFVKSLAAGKGVVEFEPSGRSADEIRQLYIHTNQQGDT